MKACIYRYTQQSRKYYDLSEGVYHMNHLYTASTTQSR